MKRWLYVMQQRLAITNREATALLTISSLLVIGMVAGEVRSRMPVFTDETYATYDRLFQEGSHAAMGGLQLAMADTSVGVRDSISTEADTDQSPQDDAGDAAQTRPQNGTGRIDLNTASAEELQQLPRIGPALANRILAYRKEFGPFRELADVMEVRGIGEATFSRLRPYLMLGSQENASASQE